jgi:2-phospho-L-lactate guanylyltransferase
MSVTAIIPFRSLVNGKTRLSPVLSVAGRQLLCRWMLTGTLEMLKGVSNKILVTDDPAVSSFLGSRHPDLRVLVSSRPGQLNAAIDDAKALVPSGHGALVVPTDLVMLDPNVISLMTSDPLLVRIAPDRHGSGTNLLHVPSTVLQSFNFHFGLGSFGLHQAEARRLGISFETVDVFTSSFDLDTPEDLEMFRSQAVHELHLPMLRSELALKQGHGVLTVQFPRAALHGRINQQPFPGTVPSFH